MMPARALRAQQNQTRSRSSASLKRQRIGRECGTMSHAHRTIAPSLSPIAALNKTSSDAGSTLKERADDDTRDDNVAYSELEGSTDEAPRSTFRAGRHRMPLIHLPPRSAQLRDHTGDSTRSVHRDSDLSLSSCCKWE